jgi:hypothetical protein
LTAIDHQGQRCLLLIAHDVTAQHEAKSELAAAAAAALIPCQYAHAVAEVAAEGVAMVAIKRENMAWGSRNLRRSQSFILVGPNPSQESFLDILSVRWPYPYSESA